MEHIAIMKKSWGLTKKILSGEKRIESRWYVTKRDPWNHIAKGETVYFKDSGDPITIKATVSKVERFEDLNPEKVKDLLQTMHKEDGIEDEKIDEYAEIFREKKYCMLIHLENPQKVAPFNINKKGFGLMSAWICVDDVNKIRI